MAIISEQTLGELTIYEVDTKPTHTAVYGSLAFHVNGTMWMYVHGSETDAWFSITPKEYEDFAHVNINEEFDLTADAAYYITGNSAGATLTGFNSGNWSIDSNYRVRYDGSQPIRVLANCYYTYQQTGTKWQDTALILAKNNTIPTPLLENIVSTSDVNGDPGEIETMHIEQIFDMVNGDWLSHGISIKAKEVGGGNTDYTLLNFKIGIVAIDAGVEETLLEEDWESGDFTTNGWTTINDTTNQWVVGTAVANGGTQSAYISDNSGTQNQYTITAANVSHFYIDIVFPAGATSAEIAFDWQCQGENGTGDDQYDYGRVFVTDTGTTPVAGTQLTTGQVGALKYNLQPTWASETIKINEEVDDIPLAGLTKRIVFSWANDGASGAQSPWALDNIKITTINY